ncbi:MAG: hypothetical protein M3391_01925 [Actinomycetota bacterium]|nr:hypothetical protein [Actinomycetota bacterium]
MRVFSVPIQLAIALATVGLMGCGPADAPAGDIEIELDETGDSGKSGTAALNPKGEQTLIVIQTVTTEGEPVSELRTAHIHEGTCDELPPEPAFELQGDSDGRSVTTVNAALDTLTSGTYAIALHESDVDLALHSSCGNIEP